MRRRLSLRVIIVTLLAVMALVLSACSDDDSADGDTGTTADGASDTTTDSGSDDPASDTTMAEDGDQFGGELTILDWYEPASLDPIRLEYNASSQPLTHAFAIYGALVYEDNATGAVVPHMAESLTTEDGLNWTLKLREGLTFTDGTPYDAEAVVYNWDRAMSADAEGFPIAANIATIASYEAVDDLTVELTLDIPNTSFGRTLAGPLSFIGSPTAIEASGTDFGQNPVGAGPFMLDSWRGGGDIVVVKNDGFWDAPRPYLDSIVFSFNEEESQRVNSLSGGEVDVISLRSPEFAAVALDDGSLQVYPAPAIGGEMWQPNHTTAPFDDIRMRQAWASGTDLQALNDALFNGLAAPTHVFPPDSAWVNLDAPFPTYDPEATQALIDEYVAENGGPVEVVMIGASVHAPVYEYVAAQWSQYDNIDVTFEILEIPALIEQRANGDYQMSRTGLGGPAPDPAFFDNLHCDGAENEIQYCNAEFDALLDSTRATTDLDEQIAIWSDIQDFIIENMVYSLIWQRSLWLASGSDVEDLTIFADAGIRPDTIWLSQ